MLKIKAVGKDGFAVGKDEAVGKDDLPPPSQGAGGIAAAGGAVGIKKVSLVRIETVYLSSYTR